MPVRSRHRPWRRHLDPILIKLEPYNQSTRVNPESAQVPSAQKLGRGCWESGTENNPIERIPSRACLSSKGRDDPRMSPNRPEDHLPGDFEAEADEHVHGRFRTRPPK